MFSVVEGFTGASSPESLRFDHAHQSAPKNANKSRYFIGHPRNKKSLRGFRKLLLIFGRSDMIRTCDPCVPNAFVSPFLNS